MDLKVISTRYTVFKILKNKNLAMVDEIISQVYKKLIISWERRTKRSDKSQTFSEKQKTSSKNDLITSANNDG